MNMIRKKELLVHQLNNIKQMLFILFILTNFCFSFNADGKDIKNYNIKFINNFIIINYNNNKIKIKNFPSSFDCKRYMTVDKDFYLLPQNIQEKSIEKLKILTENRKLTVVNNFPEQFKNKQIYIWDKSCLALDKYKPWGERGIYPLPADEINTLFSKEIRTKFNLYYETPLVYSYNDKEGLHYLVIDSPYESLETYNYPKDIKIYTFIMKNNHLTLAWKIRDFSKDEIYIHIDENIKDIDNDGYVDPILYYFLENEFKIILVYKGKKVIIRAKNIDEMKNTKIYIDKQLYSLPQEIQNAVVTKIKHLLMQTSPSINYIFNIDKQILSQPLILRPNEQLLKEFE